MFNVGKWLGWEISKNETSIMYEGYRDPIDENGNYVEPRFSEYDLGKCYSSKWKEENGYFYYRILNNPSTLSMTDVQKTLAKALNSWTLVYTNFKFQELLPSSNYSGSKFNISFESPKHVSDSVFGSTLEEGDAGQAIDALAIYFNKDIKWRIYKVGEKVDNESTDFYSIAMFTIGQLHQWDTSKNETSIMYEGYRDPIDENGNYVEPTFSEEDLEYSAIWRQRAAESFYTEDEFLKDVEKNRKQKEEEKQRKTLGTQL
uniref:Peptidase M10 metallopeptidase domain-containing protein n=1 Tax=Panagrolaimus davidi TaxID=227884 RepID=A0A914P672_9BILA